MGLLEALARAATRPYGEHVVQSVGRTLAAAANGTVVDDTTVTSGPHAGNSELSVFYYFGASITLAASLFVVFSYLKFRACRQHPSSLIFWRSMCDVVFSLQFIILFSDSDGFNKCGVFSFLFQFSVLSSSSWYFMNAVDLLRSMLNPFTDPKANIPLYHVYVWSVSVATSVAIVASNHYGYRSDMQLCWTSTSSDNNLFNYVNWVTFFIPTLIYYVFSIGTMIYAGLRLKKGLQETFQTRQIVLFNGIRYVAGFCAYWTFAGIIYGIIMLRAQGNESTTSTNDLPLYATFAVTIAFRGVVDVVIWVYNQKVHVIYRKWWRGEPHDDPADIGMGDTNINRALRREVLIFSTTGIALGVERANAVPFSEVVPTVEQQQYPYSLDPTEPRNMHSVVRIDVYRQDFTAKAGDDAHTPSGPDAVPVPFLDYAPQVFRFLRFQYGIDEDAYIRSIKGNTTEAMIEKFSEGGRSGSFFYFSEDGAYIVKTLTAEESNVLVKILPRFVEYMSHNRNSLVSRFCGFHSLRLYNLTIYFIVMQSVYQTTRKIHERYDLKGSFVDRHADTSAGKRAMKKPGAGGLRAGGFKQCVYKDNDLNRTVRLSEQDRVLFLHQVRKDAYFLRDCNIMDYSLLLGVHHTSHMVPDAPTPLLSVIPKTDAGLSSQRASHTLANNSAGVFTRDNGGVHASIIEGPGIYFFGLIDILQEYNTTKKLERFAKKYFRFKDPDGISSMAPEPYAERFVRFMSNMTREDDEAGVAVGAALASRSESAASAIVESPETAINAVGKQRLLNTPADSSSDHVEVDVQVVPVSSSSSSAVHSAMQGNPACSFLNPSSFSSTHAFSMHPASDPTSTAPVARGGGAFGSVQSMGITDSAHESRSALATRSSL